ncbi:hypothetical protein GGX14DRAFT_401574 [Mycena pura]|uniref:F-box domain-containing protein n=1 Tax=Mycena pura TaxID=153505 RepID=A0AAD6V3P9_9AGAR|nr:hypothetical protein GGX14DRAFT_401574 [Mycena pura]
MAKSHYSTLQNGTECSWVGLAALPRDPRNPGGRALTDSGSARVLTDGGGARTRTDGGGAHARTEGGGGGALLQRVRLHTAAPRAPLQMAAARMRLQKARTLTHGARALTEGGGARTRTDGGGAHAPTEGGGGAHPYTVVVRVRLHTAATCAPLHAAAAHAPLYTVAHARFQTAAPRASLQMAARTLTDGDGTHVLTESASSAPLQTAAARAPVQTAAARTHLQKAAARPPLHTAPGAPALTHGGATETEKWPKRAKKSKTATAVCACTPPPSVRVRAPPPSISARAPCVRVRAFCKRMRAAAICKGARAAAVSRARRGYADLSARLRIIKQANPRVPPSCTQSHSAEWNNGTWPSKMGLSHQKWDCASPSPIIFVTPRGTPLVNTAGSTDLNCPGLDSTSSPSFFGVTVRPGDLRKPRFSCHGYKVESVQYDPIHEDAEPKPLRAKARRITILLPASMSVFANELLLWIFAHLDRHTLQRVALANRTFSRLARTFLFSHFAFSRYTTSLKKHGHNPVSAPQLLQLSRYLDFWTSEEIAPHVRSCEISPQANIQVAVLSATFFDYIERFAALRHLKLSHIQLTGIAVSTLARLPMFSELLLESCEVANGDSMPSISNVLRLRHFSYISRYILSEHDVPFFEPSGREFERVQDWLPLLEPSCLHVLHTDAAPHISAVIPVFPYVHDLRVCINQKPTPADITFMQKLPGVTKLNVALNGNDSLRSPLATLPADVLPVLAEFIGPIRALSLFLARDTLTRIETDDEDSLDDFVIELQRLPAPLTNLIHLTATFSSFCTATALEAIFASLPQLEDVEITFADYESDLLHPAPAGILSKLPSIPGISPHLQLVSLIWKCSDSVKPHTVHSIESDCDFPAVGAALVAQCPDLEVLWLDGRDFIFCWHTQADNMDETEVMVTDPVDVEGVRFEWTVLGQLPQLVYEDDDALVGTGIMPNFLFIKREISLLGACTSSWLPTCLLSPANLSAKVYSPIGQVWARYANLTAFAIYRVVFGFNMIQFMEISGRHKNIHKLVVSQLISGASKCSVSDGVFLVQRWSFKLTKSAPIS